MNKDEFAPHAESMAGMTDNELLNAVMTDLTGGKSKPYTEEEHSAMVANLPGSHILKTILPHWEDLNKGVKTFEVRRNDRNFKVGDMLFLAKWSAEKGEGFDDCLIYEVTHILKGGQFGIDPEYCVMSIRFVGYCHYRDIQ